MSVSVPGSGRGSVPPVLCATVRKAGAIHLEQKWRVAEKCRVLSAQPRCAIIALNSVNSASSSATRCFDDFCGGFVFAGGVAIVAPA